jgi:hypothetical protein
MLRKNDIQNITLARGQPALQLGAILGESSAAAAIADGKTESRAGDAARGNFDNRTVKDVPAWDKVMFAVCGTEPYFTLSIPPLPV